MDPIRRSIRRFGPIFVVFAVQGMLLTTPNISPSQGAPVPETPFVTLVEPVGVAATTAFGYATHIRCTSETHPKRQVVSFDTTGSVRVIATLTDTSESICRELYIAVAPGPQDNTVALGYPSKNEAGFTSNELYFTDGAIISVIRLKKNPNGSVALNPDGSYQFLAPATFATIPSCGTTDTGITFDETAPTGESTTGAFGNKLIVTCKNGKVWSFDANGNTGETPIANIATSQEVSGPFEGPVVATEGSFAGTLLVAAENAFASCGEGSCPGAVFQVTPGGVVTRIANVPSAESVTVARTTKCTLGLTNGFTYFTAIFKPAGASGPGGTIDQLPRSAFTGLAGKAFVTSVNGETGIGIAQVSAPNVVTKFRDFFKEHQGSAFADCLVPVLVKIRVIRHEATITVQIFSNKNFFSGNLISSTARFGPYTTRPGDPPIKPCKLAKRERGDRFSRGDDDEGEDEEENSHKGISSCTFPNNTPPGQLGVIKFKFNDPNGPGDGDAEGGG